MNGSDEISGDQLGTLVDELVESMLSVGSSLTPDDGSRLVVDALRVLGDEFTVGFHVTLLEVIGELVHVLIVRQDGLGLSTEEVDVPDADQSQQGRQVLLERGVLEVEIHLVSSEQSCSKLSKPMTMAMERPMADQREYRPPTQSQNLNMFSLAIPNSVAALTLVLRATKCLAT